MLTEIVFIFAAVAVLMAGVYVGKRLSFRVRLAIGALFLIALWLTPFNWYIVIITAVVVSSLWKAYHERQRSGEDAQGNVVTVRRT